jgi:hypothetical protein
MNQELGELYKTSDLILKEGVAGVYDKTGTNTGAKNIFLKPEAVEKRNGPD